MKTKCGWIVEDHSKDLSEISSLEELEGRWRMITADERVEQVGCIMRKSEMEEGLIY